jgi:hypothetical protein
MIIIFIIKTKLFNIERIIKETIIIIRLLKEFKIVILKPIIIFYNNI